MEGQLSIGGLVRNPASVSVLAKIFKILVVSEFVAVLGNLNETVLMSRYFMSVMLLQDAVLGRSWDHSQN